MTAGKKRNNRSDRPGDTPITRVAAQVYCNDWLPGRGFSIMARSA